MAARSTLIEDVLEQEGKVFYKISSLSNALSSSSGVSRPPDGESIWKPGGCVNAQVSSLDAISQILSALLDLACIKG